MSLCILYCDQFEFKKATCRQLSSSYGHAPGVHQWTPHHPINQVNYINTTNGTKLPVMLKGKLIKLCSRTSFVGKQYDDQMNAMNRKPTDEKGHLLASQLCGPIVWWNLAPQSPLLNKNQGIGHSGWKPLETRLANWLKGRKGRKDKRYVDWTVLVNYEIHISFRPIGFKVCYKEFDANGKAHGRLKSPYFVNE